MPAAKRGRFLCGPFGERRDGTSRTGHCAVRAIRRRDQDHHLLHVRLPLRHPGASEGRPRPLHRRQPRSSGQPGRDLRQGRLRHHDAHVAVAAARAAEASRAARLRRIRAKSPGTRRSKPRPAGSRTCARATRAKLAFFTGRDQSQALTGWFAQQYGTQNFAAHGGFCSVNMAAAGLYTFGGSFWEFGEPDWEHTRYFMLFGVAEDHASNPLKIELGKLKAQRRQGRRRQSDPHRLRRDRRRMDRHPARHRRIVRRRADP